jgi:hypothetical protein
LELHTELVLTYPFSKYPGANSVLGDSGDGPSSSIPHVFHQERTETVCYVTFMTIIVGAMRDEMQGISKCLLNKCTFLISERSS